MNPIFTMSALYVGDLHPAVTEMMLFQKFSTVGQTQSTYVCRDRNTGSSRGFGFVNFQQRVDAERALDLLNNELLLGRPMRVMWDKKNSSLKNSGKGNLFFKGLDESMDSKALSDTLSAFGTVLSCKVIKYKGYGYVQFECPEAAEKAMKRLNGTFLNNRQVSIEPFKTREQREAEAGSRSRPFTSVYVRNLDKHVDDNKLSDIFSRFGRTHNVHVVTDEQGRSKGFGFVKFVRHEDAQRAVSELNQKVLFGKRLYVNGTFTKAERQMWGGKPVYASEQTLRPQYKPKVAHHQTGDAVPPRSSQMVCKSVDLTHITATAANTAPVADSAPAVEECVSVVRVPAEESLLVDDETPAQDSVPAEGSIPVVRMTLSEDNAPGVESSPEIETAPAVDTEPAASTPGTSVSELQPDQETTAVPMYPPGGQLTIYILESAEFGDQIRMAHDHLLPLVEKIHPEQANKITWMLVQDSNNFMIMDMISLPEVLQSKVEQMDALLKAREAGHTPESLKMIFNSNNKGRKKKKRNAKH